MRHDNITKEKDDQNIEKNYFSTSIPINLLTQRKNDNLIGMNRESNNHI